MMKNLVSTATVFVWVTLTVQEAALADYIYTTLNAPGADRNGGTSAYGINNAGQVVGLTSFSGGANVFIYSGGSYTSLNLPFVPGPGSAGGAAVGWGTGINDVGQITGVYNQFNRFNGFVERGGLYTTIFVPGSSSTLPGGINNIGDVVGNYNDNTGGHGFFERGGVYTTLDFPGNPGGTQANGINDLGQVVGTYQDLHGSHGIYTDLTALSKVVGSTRRSTCLVGRKP